MWSRSPEGGSQFSGLGKNQGPDPQAEPGNGYDYNPTGRGHKEVNTFACLVCHSGYSCPHGVWGAEGRGDDGICGHQDRTWGPVVPGWSPSPSTGRRWPLTLVQRESGCRNVTCSRNVTVSTCSGSKLKTGQQRVATSGN